MDELTKFREQKLKNIEKLGEDDALSKSGADFLRETAKYNYTYNFTWMGVPLIQVPQDMIAMQEIIWETKPDLIIETGIAHGGSLIYYASILQLIGSGHVLGVDIEIRPHNKIVIENHPMSKRISMIEGSSVDQNTIQKVRDFSSAYKNIMVVLDSNHTHEHVLLELNAYSKLVTKNNYLVVFDTLIEDMPENFYPDRPWGKGNNPKTAVREFIRNNNDFVIDESIPRKILITVAPDGYLKRIR